MENFRQLGNYIEKLIKEQNVSIKDLMVLLECNECQIRRLFKGRCILSFNQLQLLAKQLKITVHDLLNGDNEHYNNTIVHSSHPFSNSSNREFILDIIDDYIDLVEFTN